MKLFFKRLLLTVFYILVLSITLLLSTSFAPKYLILGINHIEGHEIQLGNVQGTLATHLQIHNIDYTAPDMHVTVDKLYLHAALSSLLVGRLTVKHFDVYGIRIHAKKTHSKKQPVKTKTSFKWHIPIAIDLKNIDVYGLLYYSPNKNTASKHIQRIHLSAFLHRSDINVNDLYMKMRPYTLTLSGKTQLSNDYTSTLHLVITNWTHPLKPIQLNITGNGNKQNIQFNVSSPELMHSQIHGHIEFTGSEKINIQGNWQHVEWPLSEKNSMYSNHGHLAVNGTLHHYTVSMNSDLYSNRLPASTINMTGSGSKNDIHFSNITAHLLDGSIQGNIDVTWSPELKWQASLQGKKLNPAIGFNAWPGIINFNVNTQGEQPAHKATPNFQIDLKNLTGTLRNYTLNASLHIQHTNNSWHVFATQFSTEDNYAKISGNLNTHSDLTSTIHLNALHKIVPFASGQVNSTIHISGNMSQPEVKGNLSLNQITIQENKINHADADVNINAHQFIHAQLAMNGIAIDKHNIPELTSRLTGTQKNHVFNLAMTTQHGRWSLKLNGHQHEDYWNGKINAFNFVSKQLGTWQLKAPFDLSVGNYIDVSPFCWRKVHQKNNTPEIAGQLHYAWSKEWSAKLNVQHLNINLFEDFFPSGLTISGLLNTQLDANKNAKKRLRALLNVSLPGLLIHYTDPNSQRTFRWKIIDTRLNSSVDSSGLKANLRIRDDKQALPIDVNIHLPQYFDLGIPTTEAPINASIQANWNDLSRLNGILPDIHQLSGKVSIDTRMTGSIDKPTLSGHINIKNAAFFVKPLNVLITKLKFVSQLNNHSLPLHGEFTSGKGSLKWKGIIHLRNHFNRSSLHLYGDNVTVINNDDYKISLSPDVNILYNNAATDVSGTINIPQANITPKDFTKVTDLPINTVIITPTGIEHNATVLPIKLKLKLLLGNAVNFKYAGVNATLGGELSVFMKPNALMTATGNINVTKGFYNAYGQKLDVSRGLITYTGGPIENPALDILATKTIMIKRFTSGFDAKTVIVGVHVTGSAAVPAVTLYSVPTMNQNEILSYLVFGQSSAGLSDSSFQLLGEAAQAMGIGGQSNSSSIQEKLGLNELGFESEQTFNPKTNQPASNTAFVVGKQLSKKLSITYSMGILIPVSILRLRYMLTHHIALQTDASSYDSGADALYTIEW